MFPEMVSFMNDAACFEDIDAQMLDNVLDKKNARLMLDNLVTRGIFTVKACEGHYRFHALMREFLLKGRASAEVREMERKAARYYFEIKDFSKAAEYAVKSDDREMLRDIILSSYRDLIGSGKFSELRIWFQTLGDITDGGPEILVAKGAFLSTMGNFIEATKCLQAALPLLDKDKNRELYFEAMIHKARILRNNVSIGESNALLDRLIDELDSPASETGYRVIIEKLYNLCWSSKIPEAYDLAVRSAEECARTGNLRIKAWYERYLSAIYFFFGRMKESIYYYEKALLIPEEESRYLELHSIGIYAAKAYQMMGDKTRAHAVLSEELKKMRNTGKYEELWSGYLFAAEVYFQDSSISRANGINDSYDATKKYFILADEYAPLYRKADFQKRWAKMQRLTYGLMFSESSWADVKSELLTCMESADDYLKSSCLRDFSDIWQPSRIMKTPLNMPRCVLRSVKSPIVFALDPCVRDACPGGSC